MKKIASIILLSVSFYTQGQDSFYSSIELGEYKIGYCDSIIFNEKEDYNQFRYSGAAPMFVQIWHPLKSHISDNFMNYGDFRKRELPNNLDSVYNRLSIGIDKSFISYNIKEEFETFQTINYEAYTYEQVLDTLKKTPTKSIRYQLAKKTDFPIIIYHHGGQGLPDENYIMAEYFASRGYIFISSNFHLPYEGMDYGSSSGVSDLSSFPKRLTTFAKKLTTSDKIFFIGHSWGAQVGLTYLYEEGWASGFVSLETTIEFKKDNLEIKQKWPNVYKIIKNDYQKFSIPILLIANTREDKKFTFFEDVGKKDVFHVSAKNKFGHESYTSAYLLRQLYNSIFPQPDITIMKTQLHLYSEHLKLIELFFEYVKSGKVINKEYVKKYFYINTNTIDN